MAGEEEGKSWDTIPSRIAQNSITVILVVAFTALRFYIWREQVNTTGRHTKKTEIFSLACIVISSLMVIGECGIASYDTHLAELHGGAEGSDANFEMSPQVQVLNFSQNYLHTMSIWFLKGSYFAMFFELRKRLPRSLQLLIYVTAGFCIAGFTTSIFLHSFWCAPKPLRTNWYLEFDFNELELPKIVSCNILFDKAPVYVLALLSIASDIMILTVGVRIVKILKIKGKVERIAIAFIFFIGFLSMAACIGRMGLMLFVIQENNGYRLATLDSTLFRSQELACRIEVLCGTAAYGLTFPRAWLGPMVERMKGILSSFRSGFSSTRSGTTKTQDSGYVMQDYRSERSLTSQHEIVLPK